MTKPDQTKRIEAARVGEKGSALLIAIFAAVLLTAMALALLSMSGTEAKLGSADVRSKESFYLAESGLEHARLALYALNKKGSFDDDLVAASGGVGGNNAIDFDPAALQPVYDAAGILTGFSAGVGDDTPLVPVTPFANGAYAAFLTNDPVDASDIDDQNGRVMLTGVGAGRNGSFEVVQAVIEFSPLMSSPPPATITLLGPLPNFTPGNSNAKMYEGDDCSGTYFVPAVGAVGPAATAHVRANKGKPTYKAGGLPSDQVIADVDDTSEPTVSSPIGPEWKDCRKLKSQIEQIRKVADVVCVPPGPCVVPPSSPSRVVFVDGDYNLKGGAGLFVVTGRLNFTGNVSWSGMLLIVGEGVVQRSGGGSGTLSGSIVVADIAGPDDVYGTADDCTGGDGGFSNAEFTTSGGGNSTVQYCGATIDDAIPSRPYQITEFLQR